jgi:putative ABC transport system substrate-binding protein
MKRLAVALLCLALLAAPLAVEAQPAGKVFHTGYLLNTGAPVFAPETIIRDRALADGLRALGYVIGQNVVLEVRSAEDQPERLPALAVELARARPDVIFAPSTLVAQAVAAATQSIPIVFCFAADPVGDGLIASFARPGGNLTGLTTNASELSGKRLEFLRSVVPAGTPIGAVVYPGYAQGGRALRATQEAAQRTGAKVRPMEARDRETEFDVVFATLARERVRAVILIPHPLYFVKRKVIAELALKHRLATICEYSGWAEAGELMAYGASYADQVRRSATYIDRILKGAKPADLPVEQPTKFELVINLKTAQALGLTIPPSVLARADEIIQ